MAKTQTQPDYPRGLDFEQVWAALMETKARQEESKKEFDRLMKESRERDEETKKEFDRQLEKSREDFDREMKESRERFDRQMEKSREDSDRQKKEFNERLGAFTNLFGEISEYVIAPKLREKFTEFGFDFQKTNRNTSVSDRTNNISLEIDVMLENGDNALLVEIKTKLTIERINAHVERLNKMRKYANLHGDKRTFLGAVAGVVVSEEAREYALNQGFFLIEPSGDNFNITPPNGEPREW